MGRDAEDEESEFRFLADAEVDDDAPEADTTASAHATSDGTGAFEFGDDGAADGDAEVGKESDSGSDDTEHRSGVYSGDDGHDHHPVVQDWPRGVGEASWWPIVTALGAAGIYASVALFLLGRGQDSLIAPEIGPIAFVGAVGVVLVGVYGWLYHGFLAHFWTRGTDSRSARSLRWGMLGFLASEIATFSAPFVFYAYIRAGPWPPAESLLPEIDLLNVLVVSNSAVLVLSSITLHFAHHSLQSGKRRRFQRLLALTIGLGCLFLAGQAVEYNEFVSFEGIDWASGVFFSVFFALTGLHGLHVAFGTLLLAITYVRGKQGQFDEERDLSVALVSLYWHFVDAVWLFLVVVLYVGASLY